MWLEVVLSTVVLMTANGGEINNVTSDPELDIKELVGGLSDQNQAAFVNPEYEAYIKNFTAHHPPKRPYEQFQPSSLLRGRDWEWEHISERFANEDSWQSEHFKQYIQQNPGSNSLTKTCFLLSSIYQRARVDILKYYKFRDFYVNNLEYEVGYLCHVIIEKYMNMLELYEIVMYRFVNNPPPRLKMPPRYMFFIYVNIVEYSKTIIHYCNMLHELEFRYEEAGEETHWTGVDDEEDNEIKTATLQLSEKKQKGVIAKHQEQLESYLKYINLHEAKNFRDNQKRQKLLHRDVTTRSPRPARFWAPKRGGVDYGWSVEHWYRDEKPSRVKKQ